MNIQHHLAPETYHPRQLFVTVRPSEQVSFPVSIRYPRLARPTKTSEEARVISKFRAGAERCQGFSS
jgi:hypothetical protein